MARLRLSTESDFASARVGGSVPFRRELTHNQVTQPPERTASGAATPTPSATVSNEVTPSQDSTNAAESLGEDLGAKIAFYAVAKDAGVEDGAKMDELADGVQQDRDREATDRRHVVGGRLPAVGGRSREVRHSCDRLLVFRVLVAGGVLRLTNWLWQGPI